MRIAMVHSFYSSVQPSGENQAVQQQAGALRRAGHEVVVAEQHTDARARSLLYPLEAGATVATGIGRSPRRLLREFQPDLVHVHNLFPNYGRRWVLEESAPVAATLHNYRPLCPAGTFYRKGKDVCMDCMVAGSAVPAVRHGCYRGRGQSIPVAIGTRFADDPVLRGATLITVLTETMRDHYALAGVPARKMRVIPNFVSSHEVPPKGDGGDYWLYVGRLSPEKGILDLARRWPRNHKLVIAGDGADFREIQDLKKPSLHMLGSVEKDRVMELMRGAMGLVFPSKCLEGLALVCLESLACGTPILAWRPTTFAEVIEQHGVGAVGLGDLSTSLDLAASEFPNLRKQCRRYFEDNYSEDSWLSMVTEAYHEAVNRVK